MTKLGHLESPVTGLACAVALLFGVMTTAMAAAPAKTHKTADASPATAAAPSAPSVEAPVAEATTPSAADLLRAEEEKRKREEKREAQREAAKKKAEARKARQAAWEARCVIRPAMSDEEIATCREVRTRPAP